MSGPQEYSYREGGMDDGVIAFGPEPITATKGGGCPRLGKWIKGCKFKPRYDTTFVGMDRHRTGNWLAPNFGSARAEEKYVAEVCVRCGKGIAREHIAAPLAVFGGGTVT